MDIDNDGNIWLGTLEVGVIKINVVSKDSLSVVTFNNELLTSGVYELKVDGHGRVWFRTSSGVNILDSKTMSIKSLEKRDGLFDLTRSLLKFDNRVFGNGSLGYGSIDEKDLFPVCDYIGRSYKLCSGADCNGTCCGA